MLSKPWIFQSELQCLGFLHTQNSDKRQYLLLLIQCYDLNFFQQMVYPIFGIKYYLTQTADITIECWRRTPFILGPVQNRQLLLCWQIYRVTLLGLKYIWLSYRCHFNHWFIRVRFRLWGDVQRNFQHPELEWCFPTSMGVGTEIRSRRSKTNYNTSDLMNNQLLVQKDIVCSRFVVIGFFECFGAECRRDTWHTVERGEPMANGSN
jgi:hypothetical protein